MALAKKCDRCGKLYELKDIDACGAITNELVLVRRYKQNARSLYTGKLCGSYSYKYFDLCPECLVSLAGWLKNEPMTFNEIRKAVGLEPIRESDKAFAQLYSEKENGDGNGKEM